MQERFYKVLGKVLKLWERLYHREKVGKVSKFQERLFNDNFKARNGEERKGKGKLSVLPPYTRGRRIENFNSKFLTATSGELLICVLSLCSVT